MAYIDDSTQNHNDRKLNWKFQDLANGQFDILFYPTMAIPHKLDIKYNGLPVTTTPMEAKVRRQQAILKKFFDLILQIF